MPSPSDRLAVVSPAAHWTFSPKDPRAARHPATGPHVPRHLLADAAIRRLPTTKDTRVAKGPSTRQTASSPPKDQPAAVDPDLGCRDLHEMHDNTTPPVPKTPTYATGMKPACHLGPAATYLALAWLREPHAFAPLRPTQLQAQHSPWPFWRHPRPSPPPQRPPLHLDRHCCDWTEHKRAHGRGVGGPPASWSWL